MESYLKDSIKSIVDASATNENISISYSGGKDSTAVLLLTLELIEGGALEPHNVSVIHSDTLIEYPYLATLTHSVLDSVRELGIRVDVVSAPIQERFYSTLFGVGRPIPSYAIRWCTDFLKLRPQQRQRKLLKNSWVLTGEHFGESANRDKKLSSCGTSDCGVADIKKTVSSENLLRPIMNWSDCNVWDFIFLHDRWNIFERLTSVYSISGDDNRNSKTGSLRTGCIACPVIGVNKHYHTLDKGVPDELSLKLRLLFNEMSSDNLRVRNPKFGITEMKKNGHTPLGAIALEARKYYWRVVSQINDEFKDLGILLIREDEKLFVEESLNIGRYPKTYKPESILLLEQEWQIRKPVYLSK
ncbi:MAG: phosphoadenosine phosphosulfate reductase family protein [Nostoc sp.]